MDTRSNHPTSDEAFLATIFSTKKEIQAVLLKYNHSRRKGFRVYKSTKASAKLWCASFVPCKKDQPDNNWKHLVNACYDKGTGGKWKITGAQLQAQHMCNDDSADRKRNYNSGVVLDSYAALGDFVPNK
jgi:hypothetical protein